MKRNNPDDGLGGCLALLIISLFWLMVGIMIGWLF